MFLLASWPEFEISRTRRRVTTHDDRRTAISQVIAVAAALLSPPSTVVRVLCTLRPASPRPQELRPFSSFQVVICSRTKPRMNTCSSTWHPAVSHREGGLTSRERPGRDRRQATAAASRRNASPPPTIPTYLVRTPPFAMRTRSPPICVYIPAGGGRGRSGRQRLE